MVVSTQTLIHRVLVVALSLSSAPAHAQSQSQSHENVDDFVARSYKSPGGETMRYRLFVPHGYDATKKYPIVLWLHGANARGSDNLLQISGGNFLGTHAWTAPDIQSTDPVFVLAPQVENTKAWARPHVNTNVPVSLRLALEILNTIEKEYSINRDREYIAGQSIGGEGVWAALAIAPGRFAGAIVLAAVGLQEQIPADAKVPVWICQGDADPIVPVERARQWVSALRKAGGSPKYTEVPGAGHNVWEIAFGTPDAAKWLLSQHRN